MFNAEVKLEPELQDEIEVNEIFEINEECHLAVFEMESSDTNVGKKKAEVKTPKGLCTKRKCDSEDAIAQALLAVSNGLNVNQASKQFKVPRTTLRRYISTGRSPMDRKMGDAKTDVFPCVKCRLPFASKFHLSAHVQSCRGPRSGGLPPLKVKPDHPALDLDRLSERVGRKWTFHCQLCQFGTSDRSQMTRHLVVHSGHKGYKCGECDKTFTQASGLVTHKRVHSEGKRFQCPECPYASHYGHRLKQHAMTHSGETLFACPRCAYRTTQSGHMNRHRMTHNGRRPHKCDRCDYSASVRANLARHVASHHAQAQH